MHTRDNMMSVVLTKSLSSLGSSLCVSHTMRTYKPKYIKDDVEALSADWKLVGEGLKESFDDFERTERKRLYQPTC